MLFDELIKYCDSKYQEQQNRGSCNPCTHDSNNCAGNCCSCLHEIHFPRGYPHGRKKYNCEKIVNYYVCQFSNKFASEILYALYSFENMNEYKNLNIVSIGCGPAPDLMAFEYFNEMHNKCPITYYGFDLNAKWSSIHKEIENYCQSKNINPSFHYEEVFNLFENKHLKPETNTNFLILQYVISHYLSTGTIKELNEFYKNLTTNVISKMAPNSMIIVNDVNSCYCGRDSLDTLIEEIQKNGINIQYTEKRCFDKSRYEYGNEYSQKNLLMTYPAEFSYNYNSWNDCSCAQLIIKLGGE